MQFRRIDMREPGDGVFPPDELRHPTIGMIALDTEHTSDRRIAVLSVASTTTVWVMHLLPMCRVDDENRTVVPTWLASLLQNETVVKTVCGSADESLIRKTLVYASNGVINPILCRSFLDVQVVARARSSLQAPGDSALPRSLADLSRRLLDVSISKDLQTSNWDAPTLSEGQLQYAAADAFYTLAVAHALFGSALANDHQPPGVVPTPDHDPSVLAVVRLFATSSIRASRAVNVVVNQVPELARLGASTAQKQALATEAIQKAVACGALTLPAGDGARVLVSSEWEKSARANDPRPCLPLVFSTSSALSSTSISAAPGLSTHDALESYMSLSED